jgi:hypothetical protein
MIYIFDNQLFISYSVSEFKKLKSLTQLLTSSLILIGVSWYELKQKTRKSV